MPASFWSRRMAQRFCAWRRERGGGCRESAADGLPHSSAGELPSALSSPSIPRCKCPRLEHDPLNPQPPPPFLHTPNAACLLSCKGIIFLIAAQFLIHAEKNPCFCLELVFLLSALYNLSKQTLTVHSLTPAGLHNRLMTAEGM